MPSLKERLVSVEADFLAALVEGDDSMAQFESRLTAIMDDVDRALAANDLDSETASLAHMVSWRCATLADTSIELLSSCDSLTSQLMTQIDTLMAELTIEDISGTPSLLYSSSRSPSPHVPSKHALCELEEIPSRPIKKRKASKETCDLFQRGLPKRSRITPPTIDPFENLEVALPFASPRPPQMPSMPSVPVPNLASLSRKRRRSDGDADFLPSKRLHAGPRLSAVSDSFASRAVAKIPNRLCDRRITQDRGQRGLIPPLSPPQLDIQPLTAPVDTVYPIDGPGFLDHTFDLFDSLCGASDLAQSLTPDALSPHILDPLPDPSWLSVTFHLGTEQVQGVEGTATRQYPSSPTPSAVSSSSSAIWSASPTSTASSPLPSTPKSSPKGDHIAPEDSLQLPDYPASLDDLLSILVTTSRSEKALDVSRDASIAHPPQDAQQEFSWSSLLDIFEPRTELQANSHEQPGRPSEYPSSSATADQASLAFPGRQSDGGSPSLLSLTDWATVDMSVTDPFSQAGLGLVTI